MTDDKLDDMLATISMREWLDLKAELAEYKRKWTLERNERIRITDLYQAATSSHTAQPAEHPAAHASAPPDHKCSDCTIDKEPCAVCYHAWWVKKHSNVERVGEFSVRRLGDQTAGSPK
jgi:hypothetical protein